MAKKLNLGDKEMVIQRKKTKEELTQEMQAKREKQKNMVMEMESMDVSEYQTKQLHA